MIRWKTVEDLPPKFHRRILFIVNLTFVISVVPAMVFQGVSSSVSAHDIADRSSVQDPAYGLMFHSVGQSIKNVPTLMSLELTSTAMPCIHNANALSCL